MPRVVVVTGAGYGVGRATVEAFARRGDSIALVSRGEDSLADALSAVERTGARGLRLPTDVSDHEQVEEAARRAETELGPIDVWVNCAMATIFAPFHEMTPEEFRRATDVTYLGYVWGTMAALRRMRPRDRGTIVQVGSALAYRGIPLQAPYCGAKHAINGFTSSLRTELLHERSGVRVTSVHLPALNTPQFDVGRSKMPRRPQPLPPIHQPEVAADAIVWASEHPRREVWVGSSTAATILGQRLVPWLGDLYLARTGYSGQQTDEPADPDRPDNLFEPVPGARGARGRFDARAKRASIQFELSKRAGWIAFAAAVGLVVGTFRR